MPAPLHETVRQALPNLNASNYRITSPASWEYNCVAWWWPVAERFWPPDVPREETLDAFVSVFVTLGFVRCDSSLLESGLEKVALYCSAGVPTHVARQLPDGWWTSKLGPSFDIEHADLDSLAGGLYGDPAALLARRTEH